MNWLDELMDPGIRRRKIKAAVTEYVGTVLGAYTYGLAKIAHKTGNADMADALMEFADDFEKDAKAMAKNMLDIDAP